MAFIQDPQLFNAALAAFLDADMPEYEAVDAARISVDREFWADTYRAVVEQREHFGNKKRETVLVTKTISRFRGYNTNRRCSICGKRHSPMRPCE